MRIRNWGKNYEIRDMMTFSLFDLTGADLKTKDVELSLALIYLMGVTMNKIEEKLFGAGLIFYDGSNLVSTTTTTVNFWLRLPPPWWFFNLLSSCYISRIQLILYWNNDQKENLLWCPIEAKQHNCSMNYFPPAVVGSDPISDYFFLSYCPLLKRKKWNLSIKEKTYIFCRDRC